MKISLFALFLLAAAGSADAQQRRPSDSDKGADKPPDCAATMGALPKEWAGEAFAIDGMTMGGVGLKPQLRLWGLQASELRDRQSGQETVPGMRARATLEDILDKAEHRVKCRPVRWDRDCRLVAQCTVVATPAPIDLGGYMIASGMAWGFHLEESLPWEPRASQRYAGAEAEARKAKHGLWPT
ncbi:MAG: thermonuclease family protein, partial [Rhodospirillales bacterium]|nr:thermonuclease family protein [Rhodospirillales bacterium]